MDFLFYYVRNLNAFPSDFFFKVMILETIVIHLGIGYLTSMLFTTILFHYS